MCVCSILSGFFWPCLWWPIFPTMVFYCVCKNHLIKINPFDLPSRIGICILQKFRKFLVLLLLDLGTEDGPSVHTKLCSTLTTVAFLQTNLKLDVFGADESYGLCGCEIVGWVSEKSGCPWFPVIVMSIN